MLCATFLDFGDLVCEWCMIVQFQLSFNKTYFCLLPVFWLLRTVSRTPWVAAIFFFMFPRLFFILIPRRFTTSHVTKTVSWNIRNKILKCIFMVSEVYKFPPGYQRRQLGTEFKRFGDQLCFHYQGIACCEQRSSWSPNEILLLVRFELLY